VIVRQSTEVGTHPIWFIHWCDAVRVNSQHFSHTLRWIEQRHHTRRNVHCDTRSVCPVRLLGYHLHNLKTLERLFWIRDKQRITGCHTERERQIVWCLEPLFNPIIKTGECCSISQSKGDTSWVEKTNRSDADLASGHSSIACSIEQSMSVTFWDICRHSLAGALNKTAMRSNWVCENSVKCFKLLPNCGECKHVMGFLLLPYMTVSSMIAIATHLACVLSSPNNPTFTSLLNHQNHSLQVSTELNMCRLGDW
jgi:hypothetical protein